MRAALLRAPGELTIEEVPQPRLEPGQVLVRIMATGICGTDVAVYAGKYPVTYPLIQGHESSGWVAEVGDGVAGLARGDRVMLNSLVFCGRCRWCRRGDTSCCINGGLLGREYPGTFAEFVAVDQKQCHSLPDEMGWVDATNLAVLATVVRSQRRARLQQGMSVAVIGLGVSGLLHVQLAKAAGAFPVVGIETVPWKLELARKLGADQVMTPQAAEGKKAVQELTDGGPDLVIDAVGIAETGRLGLALVGRGGTLLSFGVDPTPMSTLSSFTLYDSELTLLGSRAQTPHDMELAIKAAKTGAVDISFLTTHRHRLADLPSVMHLRKVKPEGLRAVIEIDETAAGAVGEQSR
ncbi:MAG TPA: alcohol dehydrogenase catalytic domain-containing protein [Bacillota bacterium]|nr:alcohol dehydrogenase catalytic domain-containing protein [Bacillota bacterium]